MQKAKKDWYKRRTYAHFDRPISRDKAERLVASPSNVASHAFWPVILNPQETTSKKEVSGRRVHTTKRRPIAYAAHSDSHIYSYYAHDLGDRLEELYKKEGGDHVLAYRRFDVPKCNIHFAHEAFSYIASHCPCDVVAIDVEGFFDALDHEELKKQWKTVLNEQSLPKDHYAVYSACTNSSAVTLPELRDLFGGEVRRRAGSSSAAICTPKAFREDVKPLLRHRHDIVWDIKRKPKPLQISGIPQGLPISAVLANLYMYNADKRLNQIIKDLGGVYWRYSDDILLVVPSGKGQDAENNVIAELSAVKLTINNGKTVRRRVRNDSGTIRSFSLDDKYSEGEPAPVTYLGFNFDGEETRVRDSTISRFMIKAHRAIERARVAAVSRKNSHLKKRQLYAKLTSMGYGSAYGNHVYTRDGGILPKGAPRLGFFRYLKLAQKVIGGEGINKQHRQIESKMHRAIHDAEAKLKAELLDS
jgi:hypothetical protein